MFEQVVNIDRLEQATALFGSFDSNIRRLETIYSVNIVIRDGELKISGEAKLDDDEIESYILIIK